MNYCVILKQTDAFPCYTKADTTCSIKSDKADLINSVILSQTPSCSTKSDTILQEIDLCSTKADRKKV